MIFSLDGRTSCAAESVHGEDLMVSTAGEGRKEGRRTADLMAYLGRESYGWPGLVKLRLMGHLRHLHLHTSHS